MRLTILGAPRTKKNSLRRIKRGHRTFTVPSAAHEAWSGPAVAQLRHQYGSGPHTVGVDHSRGVVTIGLGPIVTPVTMRALVYRDRNVGDLLNYLAAVSDALEAAGVVEDDKLIVSVDGSRLLIDRERPRVEIEIEAMT